MVDNQDGEKCLARECTRKRHTRGLCASCYIQSRRMIAAGETTEAELMQRGLLLESKQGGHPPNPLRKEIEQSASPGQ